MGRLSLTADWTLDGLFKRFRGNAAILEFMGPDILQDLA
jgi:hypothetical protein